MTENRFAADRDLATSYSGLRQNVELKARVHDLEAARKTAEEIATGRAAAQRQVDTYFLCQQGRLKLREINSDVAQLIGYRRPNKDDPKVCDYCLIEVDQPAALRKALAAALGVQAVVEKNREIFFYENVRIHLDQVKELGEFLEFEAVLSPDDVEAAGRRKIEFLRGKFQISPDDLLAESYSDML